MCKNIHYSTINCSVTSYNTIAINDFFFHSKVSRSVRYQHSDFFKRTFIHKIFDTLTSLSQPLITETNLVDPALVGGAPTNLIAQPSTNPIPPVTFEQPISPVAPPPVEPAVHETAGGPTSEYVVKKGDIAGRIASRNKVTLKQLQEANPGVDLAKLKVNQKINLPAGAASPATPPAAHETAPQAASETITYTVKGGDTLTKLAKVHGTTIKAIRQASGLKSNDLKVG